MQANESVKRQLNFDLDALEGLLKAPARHSASQWVPLLPLEPNSEVEEVTVYPDRALVTRRLRGKVEAGGFLTFEGLPLAMIESSVHAAVAEGDARVVGVELVVGSKEPGEDRRARLKEEMRPLADELGEIQDRIEALLAQRAYLRGAILTPERTEGPTMKEVGGMFAFVGETEAALAEGLRKQEERAQELGEKLEPFLARLHDSNAAGREVRVDLATDRAQDVDVMLSYQVRGAGWVPAYNARYLSESEKVQLEMFGLVQQTTHEAWDDASISLSTANPASSAAVPSLGAWLLDGGGYAIAEGRGRFVHSAEDAPMAGMAQTAMVLAPTTSSTGPVVFPVSGRRTISGDGSEQRIPLGSQKFATTTEYLSIPKLVPEAYRTATVHYKGNVPLLAGQISAYVDADYVGSSHMDTTLPGEEFKVAFGTHDRIKVQRVLVERNQERAGRNKVRYTFHFRTTLHNYGDKAQTVELVDQIPVAQTDRINVKLLKATAGHTTEESDPAGLLRWRVKWPPARRRRSSFPSA